MRDDEPDSDEVTPIACPLCEERMLFGKGADADRCPGCDEVLEDDEVVEKSRTRATFVRRARSLAVELEADGRELAVALAVEIRAAVDTILAGRPAPEALDLVRRGRDVLARRPAR